MEQQKNYLASLIREYRNKKGLTQRELADAVGTSSMFISLLELGKSKVPLATLGKLIVCLEMSEVDILNYHVDQYKQELLTEIQRGKELAIKAKSV